MWVAFIKSKVEQNVSRKKSVPKNEAFDLGKIVSHMWLFRCTPYNLEHLWLETITNEKLQLMFRLAIYQVIKKTAWPNDDVTRKNV